ncbi:MAG TPA: hypothetical protein VGR35_00240 [Tepidisphaeraceae bacterium]|nr:hypothetical protein [Tepidisphaeraceae bacterium]
MGCLADDLEASLAHLKLPSLHQKMIRTTNLCERSFVEERRRTMLGRPTFAEVEAEWQRMRTVKPRKKVWWYMLFGGPDTIEALAKLLDKHGWYEILYRIYSGGSHGSDALRGFQPKKGKGLFYRPLRYPQLAPELASLAVTVGVHLFNVLAGHYAKRAPQGNSRWYVKNIMSEYAQLRSIRFEVTEPATEDVPSHPPAAP